MKRAIHHALLITSILTASCAEPIDPGKAVDKDETFEVFYEQFKKDNKLRIERTSFPIKVTIYSGYGDAPENEPKIKYLEKTDVVSGKESLYIDEKIVKKSGYLHFIDKDKKDVVSVSVGAEGSETAVMYVFEKRSGRWYLIAHEDYWGP